jgi:hypothetical protein
LLCSTHGAERLLPSDVTLRKLTAYSKSL